MALAQKQVTPEQPGSDPEAHVRWRALTTDQRIHALDEWVHLVGPEALR